MLAKKFKKGTKIDPTAQIIRNYLRELDLKHVHWFQNLSCQKVNINRRFDSCRRWNFEPNDF